MTDRIDIGMATRRSVLGDAHVDRAEAAKSDFDAPFQTLITEGAWGTVWSDPTITRRERSMLTLALLAATGNFDEIPMHIRATANTGATQDDVMQAFLHVAIYAGVPKANHAIKLAKATYAEMEGQIMTTPGEYYQRDWSVHPPAFAPGYKTSVARSPRFALISLQNSVSEITGPVFGHNDIDPGDRDLLTNYAKAGESPIGERIILHGRVLDENARPVPHTLVEIWQANAGGRYRHKKDTYLAPVDPNFGGCGRTLTDENGYYYFRTVKPGAYPWRNTVNNWRPAHVHFSVFGAAFVQRLITQCYFEGDPLIPICPIVQTIPDPAAIAQLTARLDLNATIPLDTIAYKFDIVLRGRRSTLFENRLEGN